MKQPIILISAFLLPIFLKAQVNLTISSGYITNPANSYLVAGNTAAGAISLTGTSSLVNTGYVKLAGGITSPGQNITSTAGTFILNGTAAQNITGTNFTSNTINGLVLTNAAGVNLTGGLYITDSLSLQQGDFNMNSNSLTMRSSAAITSRVAPVYGTISNGNNVTVERYIPGHRAWRLLGVPLVSTQTINEAYQEGVYNTAISPWPAVNNDPNPGYGTHISGTQSPPGLGFDYTPRNNPSMRFYDPVLDTFTQISNTTPTRIDNNDAYLIFVRGSRAVNLPQNTSAAADNTILRPKGTLKTGDQTYNCPANSFICIGNPYASTINFQTITRTNVNNSFSVWDPNLTGQYGVGAFVTYTWNGSSYSYAPTPSSAGLGPLIQSSQAFLVQNNSSTAGTLVIKESDKEESTVSNIFSPLQQIQSFRTNLFIGVSGAATLMDGSLAIFGGNTFSSGIDQTDALKPKNIRESISHNRNNYQLAIEARPSIILTDTLFYHINLDQGQPYLFHFIPENFSSSGLTAFLHDNYKNIVTSFPLSDTAKIPFATDNDAASSMGNRFFIVFSPTAPLPVVLKSIKAFEKDKGVMVEWTLSQETNMLRYEVERSANGAEFTSLGTVPSSGNHPSGITYSYLDVNPLTGANFYRVKMIDQNGKITYTGIVKVVITGPVQQLVVYPNPIVGNTINIKMNNFPAGNYPATLTNPAGQLMYSGQVNCTGNSFNTKILLPVNIAQGNYQLKVGDQTINIIKN